LGSFSSGFTTRTMHIGKRIVKGPFTAHPLAYQCHLALMDNAPKLALNGYAPAVQRKQDPWGGFLETPGDAPVIRHVSQTGGGGASAPQPETQAPGAGGNEVRGTIDRSQPPVAGPERESPGADQGPSAPGQPEKRPTVDSKIPGQVETNPRLDKFPDIVGGYWTPEGEYKIVVKELPKRSLTPNETKYYGDKYGPWAFGALEGVSGGASGAKLGAIAGGKVAGPPGAAAGGILGGVGGAAGGIVHGAVTGPRRGQEFLQDWDFKVDVPRYGGLHFEEVK